MTIDELKARLVSAGVSSEEYSLTGGLPNEAYCIEQLPDGTWRTYYSERGQRSGLKVFKTEKAACEDFFNEINSDILDRRE